jgi:uncharacterized membrane-anchored protein
MNRRTLMLFFGLIVSLGGVNWLVINKESLLSTGTKVFLKLAPIDPRSLIQGDYMQLEYAVARDLREVKGLPTDGYIVLRLDDRAVGTFLHLYKDGDSLASNEILLRFRTRNGMIRLGSGAFFFQEGHAKYYERANYGEFRVARSGTSVLVGLCDEIFTRITPKDSLIKDAMSAGPTPTK